MDIKQIVLDLCAMNDEQEWFEFKPAIFYFANFDTYDFDSSIHP